MSEMVTRGLPEGFKRGPIQGSNLIGEVTEALHRFIIEGWDSDAPRPRVEEDLSFVPKDREQVIYVYMYRTARNTALMNAKRWREAKFRITDDEGVEEIYFERAPLYLDLFYVIAVHAKFRSDAERLAGWVLMRLYDATHLVYRPRRYILPNGREVDSTGKPWSLDNLDDDVIMEKVSMNLVDDLTIGDAINFFTINEAPYRPYLTYRAKCSMEGALMKGAATTVAVPRMGAPEGDPSPDRPNGRMGRIPTRPKEKKNPIGPAGHDHRPLPDNDSEE
jgi:hypothetical protein